MRNISGISSFSSAISRARHLILGFQGCGRDKARYFASFLGHVVFETRPSRTSAIRMGKAKDKAILGKAYITWFRLQITNFGKNEHILHRSPESCEKLTLLIYFFRVPPGLFWDATTKMMMCLESWRSKYYFSSEGIHVPWFQGRNFLSKRSLQMFKNEMYRENGASWWKFSKCTKPTQAEFFIWTRYI